MVFRRRVPLHPLARLRELVWPRMGYRRAVRYLGWRVVRLPGSAYAISGGFAWGAAISFSPFIGLHFVLSALLAWLTRCNVIAAILGTAVGNPWTFPFIWAAVYQTGVLMLGREVVEAPPLETLAELFDSLWHAAGNWVLYIVGLGAGRSPADSGTAMLDAVDNILWPMMVGSVPYVIVVWLAFYVPGRRLVEGYQHRRRRRRQRRRERAGAVDGDMPHIGTEGSGRQ